ncbi:MAG: MliC family protein [Burkholderiales bacterium]|nr:MliC family protein [Burkholderiales bacterium]
MKSPTRLGGVALAVLAALAQGANAQGANAQTGPSFDCARKLTSSVEQRICADPQLAALDRQVADVYAAAVAQATGADARALAAEQRGWIKGRNDCWKQTDVQACVDSAYRTRIAGLQARYRLVEPVGSARYECPGTPAREAMAAYFATDPPTAIVEYAGATQLMYAAPSGSGARYQGGGRQLWEHQGVALIRWTSAPEQSCPIKK